MASLNSILASFQKGFLKNILSGAGITLATSGLLMMAINTAIDSFKNSLNSVASTVLQFAGLIGLDVFFSLILGAIATRYIQNASKLHLSRK